MKPPHMAQYSTVQHSPMGYGAAQYGTVKRGSVVPANIICLLQWQVKVMMPHQIELQAAVPARMQRDPLV